MICSILNIEEKSKDIFNTPQHDPLTAYISLAPVVHFEFWHILPTRVSYGKTSYMCGTLGESRKKYNK